jgi:hypothetical protein
MGPPKKRHALVALNFYFQNCLLPFLAWANSKGRHWSHILTYSQQKKTPPTPPQVGTNAWDPRLMGGGNLWNNNLGPKVEF